MNGISGGNRWFRKIKNPKPKSVLVVSDSKYVVDAVEKRLGFQLGKKTSKQNRIYGCVFENIS